MCAKAMLGTHGILHSAHLEHAVQSAEHPDQACKRCCSEVTACAAWFGFSVQPFEERKMSSGPTVLIAR